MPERQRILIVDDSAEDRLIYQRLLRDWPEYTITETESGDDGLDFCREQPPDCVLLDYNLPDLDGLEFLTELAESVQGHHIAVVMLTGEGGTREPYFEKDAGFDPWKVMNFETL